MKTRNYGIDFLRMISMIMIVSDLYEASGYHTLAGLILDRLQRIPRSGEKLEWNSFVFEIMDMDGARIDKVLVTRSVG